MASRSSLRIIASRIQKIPSRPRVVYGNVTHLAGARELVRNHLRRKSTLASNHPYGHAHWDDHGEECYYPPASSSPSSSSSSTKNPVPDFADAESAYDTKSTPELVRAALCFRSCRVSWLVEHAEGLLAHLRGVVGNSLADQALKATLYGQFCAGEDRERMEPVLSSLKGAGIGSILDYAAESDADIDIDIDIDFDIDINSDVNSDINSDVNSDEQSYDPESEERCNHHLENFRKCIRDVEKANKNAGGTNSENNNDDHLHGYAAIKMTALGHPKLLARLSSAIVETKRLFSIFDADGDGLISREDFEVAYNRFFVDGNVRIAEIFEEFDPDGTGFIDYITWSAMLSPMDLPGIVKSCHTAGPLWGACPTDHELELLHALYDRATTLAAQATDSGVRLLIDAEQVRYQPAIDHLVGDLQRKFNNAIPSAIPSASPGVSPSSHELVSDHPVIYNTYQCYLRDSFERLRTDVARSERFGYHFGAKLVRGAYMETERELAKLANRPDPIHPSVDATHECYDASVDYLLRHSTESWLNTEIMCATHNKDSIVRAIESMNSHGIDRKASTISFAQLYGMSDQLVSGVQPNQSTEE